MGIFKTPGLMEAVSISPTVWAGAAAMGLSPRDVGANKTPAPFPAQEQGDGAWGFAVSGATAVSNLPAIFFWASKAPRMAGTGHMGSPSAVEFGYEGSKPSSGFGAGVSPEPGSVLHPKFPFTPTFTGFLMAGCGVLGAPCRSQAGIALKAQENELGVGRHPRGPCPARKRGRGVGEQESGAGSSRAVFCVIHTWKREKRVSDGFET